MSFFEKEKSKVESLYEKYKFLLLKISKDILKDTNLAEDIVHQTFVKVIENMDKIDNIDSSKTRNFLAIICRNLSLNMYKNIKQKEFLYDDEIGIEEKHTNMPIEEIIISNSTVDLIIEEILKLPIIYRDVLLLEKIYGYDRIKIANILEVSIENINKRSQRARYKLSEVLKEKGVIESEKERK